MHERCNMFSASRSRLNYYSKICFVSTTTNSMKCLVNWISTDFVLSCQTNLCFFWSNPTSRLGWVFLERTQILNGIQFTTHFIEFFVVETKQFVVSSVNVILTRQPCGQHSSRAAQSKRWALGNYFSNMFRITKFRGDWDLGQCTCWVLAKRKPGCNDDFRKKTCFNAGKKSDLSVLQTRVPKLCTDLDLGLFYIWIFGNIYQIRSER